MFKKLTINLLWLCLFAGFNANAWTIQENYDSLSQNQQCGAWTQAVASSIVAYSGGLSCANRINQGSTGGSDWGGLIGFPTNLVKGDEIWLRINTYMPAGFNYNSIGEGELLKFLRVHTRTASNPNIGYNDWYITPTNNSFATHQFIYEGEQKWSYVTDMSLRPVVGVWETYEMYLKLDDVPAASGGEARVRFWKNGQLILDIADRKTLQSPGVYADRMHLFTYWNGGAPQTQEMYIDDLFITTAPPSNTDASGNRFIGVATATPAPKPPSNVQ